MSKQLKRLREKYAEMIRDAYRDSDGVWIEFNVGWTNLSTGCHSIHEGTIREAIAAMKWTERCRRKWCVKDLEEES